VKREGKTTLHAIEVQNSVSDAKNFSKLGNSREQPIERGYLNTSSVVGGAREQDYRPESPSQGSQQSNKENLGEITDLPRMPS